MVDDVYPPLLVREVRVGYHEMLIWPVVEGCLATVQLDQVD